MSCYQMTPNALAVLARSAVLARIVTSEREAFKTLWLANANALHDRYGDAVVQPPMPAVLPPSASAATRVLATIQTYRYQCSDWKDFTGSDADRITDALRSHWMRLLPGFADADTNW